MPGCLCRLVYKPSNIPGFSFICSDLISVLFIAVARVRHILLLVIETPQPNANFIEIKDTLQYSPLCSEL